MDTTITTTVDGVLGITMSRRRVMRLLGAAGASAMVAGITTASRAGAAPSAGSYRSTTDLNLRAKPSTSAKVLLVIPSGAVVEEIGDRKNGFMKCRYGGKTGWAYEAYLESPASNDDPAIIGTDATNTDVNLRSGPSTSSQVLRVLDPGSEVSISDRVVDGFRYVVHLGLGGWVWDAYIGGVDQSGSLLTTTSAVNFRAKASTSAKVIRVLAEGTTVHGLGEGANGFVKVTYNGQPGWVYGDFLN